MPVLLHVHVHGVPAAGYPNIGALTGVSAPL